MSTVNVSRGQPPTAATVASRARAPVAPPPDTSSPVGSLRMQKFYKAYSSMLEAWRDKAPQPSDHGRLFPSLHATSAKELDAVLGNLWSSLEKFLKVGTVNLARPGGRSKFINVVICAGEQSCSPS